MFLQDVKFSYFPLKIAARHPADHIRSEESARLPCYLWPQISFSSIINMSHFRMNQHSLQQFKHAGRRWRPCRPYPNTIVQQPPILSRNDRSLNGSYIPVHLHRGASCPGSAHQHPLLRWQTLFSVPRCLSFLPRSATFALLALVSSRGNLCIPSR